MELSRVGNRFRRVLRTTSGRKVLGTIFSPSSGTPTNVNFQSPRRLLKVSPGATLVAGEVIITSSNRFYLCAENGEGEYDGTTYRTFMLIEVPKLVSWGRRAMLKDPVTGIDKATGVTSLGSLRCALEPAGDDNDQINIPKGVYRAITGEAIQAGDMLDGRLVVKRVETLLGVQVAEVS